METEPGRANLTPYESFALALMGRVCTLLDQRNIPDSSRLRSNSLRRLSLTPEELAQAGLIFNHHVLDAPEELTVDLIGSSSQGASAAPKGTGGLLTITGKYQDVITCYNVWPDPAKVPPVLFYKDSVRVLPSPIPRSVGSFATEASVCETLCQQKTVPPYEQAALNELIDMLSHTRV